MSITLNKTTNILTIAASDPSSGAGAQANLKTIHSLGGFALTAITALTAQNTLEVTDTYPTSCTNLKKQLDAIAKDIPIHAIKVGMLFHKDLIDVVGSFLKKHVHIPIVLDPVMVSTSGSTLLQEDAKVQLVNKIFPNVSVITPNLNEAKRITNSQNIETIFKKLQLLTDGAILVKDINPKSRMAEDILQSHGKQYIFKAKRIQSNNTHGTGCTLSSAIATFLAFDNSLIPAVTKAKKYITKAIEKSQSLQFGHGHGPLLHL